MRATWTAAGSVLVMALLAVLLPSERADACCMAPQLRFARGTPEGVELGAGGAALVAVRMGYGAGTPYRQSIHELAVAQGAQRVRARLEWIVPGLARLVPATALGAGAWMIDGLDGPSELRIGSAPLPPPLAAPQVRAIRRTESEVRFATIVNVEADLAAPIPAGAVFVIATWGGAAGTYAAATSGESTSRIFSSPGRCGATAPGHEPPPRGARTRVAFVDAQGRASAWSQDVVVQ